MADIVKRRDTEDAVWQVLTSFGFAEEESFTEKQRYFILDKWEAAIVDGAHKKSRADAVAACVESAFAADADDFEIHISSKEIFDILVLFGFEKILKLDSGIKDGFLLLSGNTVFSEGTFEPKKTVARIDIEKLMYICKNAEDTGAQQVSKSIVFAEEAAEGVAYDICYNLRVNGCIVELYCENGNIEMPKIMPKKKTLRQSSDALRMAKSR